MGSACRKGRVADIEQNEPRRQNSNGVAQGNAQKNSVKSIEQDAKPAPPQVIPDRTLTARWASFKTALKKSEVDLAHRLIGTVVDVDSATLHKHLDRFRHADPSRTGRASWKVFCSPGLDEQNPFTKKLFSMFECPDSDGAVDYRMFLTALAAVGLQDWDDRLSFCFRVHEKEASSELSAGVVFTIIDSLLKFGGDDSADVKRAFVLARSFYAEDDAKRHVSIGEVRSVIRRHFRSGSGAPSPKLAIHTPPETLPDHLNSQFERSGESSSLRRMVLTMPPGVYPLPEDTDLAVLSHSSSSLRRTSSPNQSREVAPHHHHHHHHRSGSRDTSALPRGDDGHPPPRDSSQSAGDLTRHRDSQSQSREMVGHSRRASSKAGDPTRDVTSAHSSFRDPGGAWPTGAPDDPQTQASGWSNNPSRAASPITPLRRAATNESRHQPRSSFKRDSVALAGESGVTSSAGDRTPQRHNSMQLLPPGPATQGHSPEVAGDLRRNVSIASRSMYTTFSRHPAISQATNPELDEDRTPREEEPPGPTYDHPFMERFLTDALAILSPEEVVLCQTLAVELPRTRQRSLQPSTSGVMP